MPIGDYLKETSDDEWEEMSRSDASWRFRPKKKGQKIAVNDILRELFDYGMEGNMYAIILRVPDEYPAEDIIDEHVDVYDSYQAVKVFADWENLKLTDHEGKEVK